MVSKYSGQNKYLKSPERKSTLLVLLSSDRCGAGVTGSRRPTAFRTRESIMRHRSPLPAREHTLQKLPAYGTVAITLPTSVQYACANVFPMSSGLISRINKETYSSRCATNVDHFH